MVSHYKRKNSLTFCGLYPVGQEGLSANVVYLISCCKCQKQYVGETKGPLNLRMNGHRDYWKHCRFERSPVAEHFRTTEHDFLKHALFVALPIAQSGQIRPGNLVRVTGSAV